jgi:trans-aconitate methyltransferase
MFKWNPKDYAGSSEAQLTWARELIAQLALRGDENVLDIGCGDGKITALIARGVPGGCALGIDSSPEMIAFAKAAFAAPDYPNLCFEVMDARRIQSNRFFDLVFSNAALHWVDDHAAIWRGVRGPLNPGGRVVASFGGKGNADAIMDVLYQIIHADSWRDYFHGFSFRYSFNDVETDRRYLEQAGLRPIRLALAPKDMTHQGPAGLASWVRTTWLPFTQRLPFDQQAHFIDAFVQAYLVKHPLDEQGRAHVPMVRLELEATI